MKPKPFTITADFTTESAGLRAALKRIRIYENYSWLFVGLCVLPDGVPFTRKNIMAELLRIQAKRGRIDSRRSKKSK